jgi:DNA polymerase III gamma/tau subunit
MRLTKFSQLVGNVAVIALLQRSLELKTLKSFAIFSGVMGTGKSSCADITGLYLTCTNLKNNEPCLECDSCKANVRAINSTGRSMNLVKINMAKLDSKKDINDVIKEIFTLQGSYGYNVYILEEFHALGQNEQLPFLEHIDRLDDSTKVLVTTTKEHKLLPELRSRAMGATYRFTRLNRTEAKFLFDKTLLRLGITKTNKETEEMLIKSAAGIPRNLVDLLEFSIKNKPNEEELRKYLGFISNEVFIDLYRSMREGMYATAKSLESLLSVHSLDTVIIQFKDFMVNTVLLVYGGSGSEFSKEDKNSIQEVLEDSVIYKLAGIVGSLDVNKCTEADFKLAVIKMHQVLNGKSVGSIITDSKVNAVTQNAEASAKFKSTQALRQQSQFGKISTLTQQELSDMAKFGKEARDEN